MIAALRGEWRGVPGEAPAVLRKRFERAITRLQQRRDALVKRSPSREEKPARIQVDLPPEGEAKPRRPAKAGPAEPEVAPPVSQPVVEAKPAPVAAPPELTE
ncbi:hypothetical protein BVG81_010415, partial [Haliangium sp. UPWRP_2]